MSGGPWVGVAGVEVGLVAADGVAALATVIPPPTPGLDSTNPRPPISTFLVWLRMGRCIVLPVTTVGSGARTPAEDRMTCGGVWDSTVPAPAAGAAPLLLVTRTSVMPPAVNPPLKVITLDETERPFTGFDELSTMPPVCEDGC